MTTILNNVFYVLLYLSIGYFVGIVRYRFVHNEKAQNAAWRNAWQAWVFYPFVRRKGKDCSFVIASHRVLGSLSQERPVFEMKPADYVSLLMFLWGPLLICVIIGHVYLTFRTITDFIWNKIVLRSINLCVGKFIQFINRSLPKDLKDKDAASL